MDPINILVGINLLASTGANLSAAQKAVKQQVTKSIYKPRTYLQKIPPNVAAIVLVLTILGIFGVGAIKDESNSYLTIRMIGFGFFIVFSWLQVWSYKYLDKNYSQDLVILHGHQLITSGPYKIVRHPQYLSQLLSDLGAGIALLGYVIIPVVILVELPLFILRAKREEQMLESQFKENYSSYKKKSGFILPFLG